MLRFLVMCGVVGALAQAPPRDSLPRPTGTGVIRGRVVDAMTGRPLRRATVNLGGIAWDSVSTNSQGVFEFRDLPPARYTLGISRNGYLHAQYGQRHFSEPGRPVELTAGQSLERITIRMLRTSSITGTITDEVGDPIASVDVMPMQLQYFQGRRQMVLAGGEHGRSDPTGFFRIADLPPGEYYLLAVTRETWKVEENGVAGVLAYAATYYPGVTTPTDVQRIKIAPGQDVTNVSFALVPGRYATISGSAFDSRGTPLVGQIVQGMQEFRGPTRSIGMGLRSSATVHADGSFVLRDVPSGEYVLRVSAANTTMRPPPEGFPAPKLPDVRPERSRVRVSVVDADVHGVVITTAPAVTASGRVESDDGVALPEIAKAVRLFASEADDNDRDVRPSPDSGRIREDGTFDIGPLFGTYRITTGVLRGGWVLKGVLHGLDDVSVVPLEIYGPKPVTGLRVLLSNRAASVTGRITSADGKPAEGTVLVFSTNREHWFDYSRFVQHARPDQHGRFSVQGLLPGEYYAVALDVVEERAWHDAEFLESLRRRAVRVTLGEREEKELQLTLR